MREIKFRAWSKRDNGFIAGFNMVNFHSYYNEGLTRSIYRYNNKWDEDEFILMQYTGLKDKNGKEIYEGDIVKWKTDYTVNEHIDKVEWSDYVAAWMLMPWVHELHDADIEIIGNIYENPELLERN